MTGGRAGKAKKILTEGRLRVVRVDPDDGLIVAHVRGDHAEYNLGYDPRNGEWRCGCPASRLYFRGKECSHLIALKMVVGR